jgi:hypothetical protein
MDGQRDNQPYGKLKRQTDRQANRQTDGQKIHSQTARETKRHMNRDKQTYGQMKRHTE